MRARICLVTAGHLATCPRIVKAADAFTAADYSVRVVSCRFVDWATRADEDMRRARRWSWSVVPYNHSREHSRLWTGVRHRGARWLARRWPERAWPMALVARAYRRAHSELIRAVVSEPVDLIYGGGGALAETAFAARRLGVPYGLDLEDLHCAEQGAEGVLDNTLAERILHRVLQRAAFLTTASEAMAAEYERQFGVRSVVVNNTFPRPARAPEFSPRQHEGLRLYWFSQTIGPGRGLEEAILAMGQAGIPGQLHLRGVPVRDYVEDLRRLASHVGARLDVITLDPARPDDMVDLCRGYDVGLALEQLTPRSRGVALTNKALTYILAGLAVVFTETPGQRQLAAELGDGAVVYPPGDIRALAAGLHRWAIDKAALARAQAASWEAAARRWHWEHASERGALLKAVSAAVKG